MKIGDLVTRNSYNNDIVFTITNIENNVCYLKGVNVRLYADSLEDDLKLYEEEVDDKFGERITIEELNRNDYFYLPGKILHIDGDNSLSNNLLNPYFIRENDSFDSNLKSLKKQRKSNFSKMYCTK